MILTEVPKCLQGGAVYQYDPKIAEKFTFIDRFDEEVRLYWHDVAQDTIHVPRNCTPIITDEKIAEDVFATSAGPRAYNWADGFVPRNTEQSRLVKESVKLLIDGGVYGGHTIEAPTGFGKTWIGASIIQTIGVRACVITTKEDIMDDWQKALASCLNIDLDQVGFWRGDQVPEKHHEVVVALVQSVCKGYHRYGYPTYRDFGMVVVDEVHRMGAEKFSEAMWWFPAMYRVGLSATPYRKDGRDVVFHGHIGPTKVKTEMETMIPKVIMQDTGWKPPQVWNWKEQEMQTLKIEPGRAILASKHLMKDERRNQMIVNFVRAAFHKGRNTVIFGDTLDGLKKIQELLIESGIENTEENMGWYTGLESGMYDAKGREGKKRQREKAKLAKICHATYKMASEATDVPWWDTAVLTTPKADVVQVVGRIRREYPGKVQPVVLDLCDRKDMILNAFTLARLKWYRKIGAEIVMK